MTENHNIIPARHIHEECGVFGIFTPQEADVASYAYYALYSLQHRGQESARVSSSTTTACSARCATLAL